MTKDKGNKDKGNLHTRIGWFVPLAGCTSAGRQENLPFAELYKRQAGTNLLPLAVCTSAGRQENLPFAEALQTTSGSKPIRGQRAGYAPTLVSISCKETPTPRLTTTLQPAPNKQPENHQAKTNTPVVFWGFTEDTILIINKVS